MRSIKTLTVILALMLTFIATACTGYKDKKSTDSPKEQSDIGSNSIDKSRFSKESI